MANPLTPCPRCGVQREARKGAWLCASCRSVLTPVEQQAWRKS